MPANTNYWRVIEASANYNGVVRTVRAQLRPNYVASSPGGTNGSNPYFNYSLFGSGAVTLGSNTQTDAYSQAGNYSGSIIMDPSNTYTLGGDVGSNSKINASAGNITVGGSLSVLGSGTNVVTGSTTTTVNRYLTADGTQDGSYGTSNVLNQSNSSVQPLAPDNSRSGPVEVNQGNPTTQLEPAPPPATPVNAQGNVSQLGSVTLSGNVTLSVSNSASPLSSAQLESLSSATSGTISIPPGNYTVSSLNLSGNANIVVDPSVSTPFRLFVDGTSPGSSAVAVNGSSNIVSSNPANMQILYNGTKNIQLNSTNGTTATVYAPNANIQIGNSNPGPMVDYYGSFAGNTINTNNAFIHYYFGNPPSTNGLYNGNYASALNGSYSGTGLINYSVVNYQEL
jgi:hypothetical protein